MSDPDYLISRRTFVKRSVQLLALAASYKTMRVINALGGQEVTAASQALGLSWKGFADTDLQFAEFFAGSFTLSLRFMPQFPNAYEGPFVAENGSGVFMIGQGDFLNGAWETKLLIKVGSQSRVYPVQLNVGQWYHLAVVARRKELQRHFTVYLDGGKVGQELIVPNHDPLLPGGTLRFGKRTTGQTVNDHDAQFYGFLDDIAVFTHALSPQQINALARKSQLTGNENNLLAGYTFNQGSLPPRLARPVTLHGAAGLVAVSSDRNDAADAVHLPLPTGHVEMTLPFPTAEAWLVVQGYDVANGSHKGYASFCWDFILDSKPDSGEYPDGSGGAPLYAAAPGKVITVRESEPVGTNTANLLEIEQSPGEIHGYLHLRQNSVEVNLHDRVTRGQNVALVGSSGLGSCLDCNHLHFGVVNLPDGTPGFVTFPIAFSNYEVRGADGAWQPVTRGIPKGGEVVRNA
jgi:hypothetical protein